jgi:hypothetical protein
VKITKEAIKALNPCRDRYENYLKFYGDKELTPAQFLGRKNITQADKMWVCFRLMPKENIRFAAADIAESVLHIYEAKYPKDDRPRKAIEAARGNDKTAAANAAAAYAAYAADDAYAAYAAAAYAAAAYAAAANAANAAAASAAAANADRQAQEKLIRKIVLKYMMDKK